MLDCAALGIFFYREHVITTPIVPAVSGKVVSVRARPDIELKQGYSYNRSSINHAEKAWRPLTFAFL